MAFEFDKNPKITTNKKGVTTVRGGLRIVGSEGDFKFFIAQDNVDSSYPDRFKIPVTDGVPRLKTVIDGALTYTRGERVAIANFCKKLMAKAEVPKK